MEDLQKNDISLLTLPRSDVGLPMPPPKAKAHRDDGGKGNEAQEESPSSPSPSSNPPPLLVLQLPAKWKVQDLKDARFVVPHQNSDDHQQQQASLVVEHRGESFQLQRVETSNSLVLVPPALACNDDDQASSLGKRRKLTAKGDCLQIVPARLLNQGSGAFFLEGRRVPLPLTTLRNALPVWDPYNNDNSGDDAATTTTTSVTPKGPSVATLGNTMAKSRDEILAALHRLEQQVVEYDIQHGRYCRLAEEVRLDVVDAVLATLVEDFGRFAHDGILPGEFLAAARTRLPKTLQRGSDGHNVSHVLIRSCLKAWLLEDNNNNDEDANTNVATTSSSSSLDWTNKTDQTRVRLSVPRVGAAVASRILTRQTVWEESLLTARWQTEMPGVDTMVSCDWLRGHAVRIAEPAVATAATTTGDGAPDTTMATDTATTAPGSTFYRKYLPVAEVVNNAPAATVVWERLVKAKPEWTLSELQPYLDGWELYSGQPSVTVLSQAGVKTENGVKIYHAV